MSLFNRRTLLFLPFALAACGFTPVYAPGGTAHALRNKVEVAEPDSVDSYLLVQNLEERLGRATQPVYSLSLVLTTRTQGQAITASNETTRYSMLGDVAYTLRQNDTQDIVASGSVDNFTGYSATGSTVETLASERDARERLMVILADQITTQLYVTVDLPEDRPT
ncbi:MAG: LPS-assembly lipoprotein [Paracoccaceae bacterium]|jgi:LPS-assembly lipoprotein